MDQGSWNQHWSMYINFHHSTAVRDRLGCSRDSKKYYIILRIYNVLSTQLTLTLSQPLPPLLMNENGTYLCHFASNGVTFMVDAVGSGATYTCNVTGEIPSEVEGLSKGEYHCSFMML